MINDLNRITLMGHLGADAKSQQNPPIPVTFSIATTDRWTDKNDERKTRTEWHNIVVFGGLCRYAATLKKGDRVYIEGQLRSHKYEKQIGAESVTVTGFEVAASQIDLVAAKNENDQ